MTASPESPKDPSAMSERIEISLSGYFCDLAFELSPGTRPAKDLLTDCRTTLNSTLCGYKSGLYRMTADVPVWVSDYGSCGERLMSIYPELQTAEEE